MIEVVTVSAASSAFNDIKKGFEVGRDIESMAGDMGPGWVQYRISRKQKSTIRNHLCLRNYLHLVLSKKKRCKSSWQKEDDMREQLRQIITYTRGQAWQELLKTEQLHQEKNDRQ